VNDEQKKLVQSAKDHHAKSTKGDWKTWGMSVMADVDGTSNVDTAITVCGTYYNDENGRPRTNDADFIAHAHNNITALIAIIEEQEAGYEAQLRLVAEERDAWKEYALTIVNDCRDDEECAEPEECDAAHKRLNAAKARLIKLGVPAGNI
jgi:hypothetical protein